MVRIVVGGYGVTPIGTSPPELTEFAWSSSLAAETLQVPPATVEDEHFVPTCIKPIGNDDPAIGCSVCGPGVEENVRVAAIHSVDTHGRSGAESPELPIEECRFRAVDYANARAIQYLWNSPQRNPRFLGLTTQQEG